MEIKKELLPPERLKPLFDDPMKLEFGKTFTDYMFTMEYTREGGWKDPKIEPYHSLVLEPATMMFHYSQAAFEGQKAYRSPRDEILLFRPLENAKRMNRSLERMCIPEIPEELFLHAECELLKLDKRWIPTQKGTSLYIRPTTGGNYAASIAASQIANNKGYSQVLWLDSKEHRYVEEVGAMNIFFVIDNKLVTPPLTGTILPGITRKSVLEMADDLEIETEERLIPIGEIVEGIESGRVTEIFGAGTAAVISPVGRINYNDKEYIVNNNETGYWAKKFFDTLTGIQYGGLEDKYGWVYKVR